MINTLLYKAFGIREEETSRALLSALLFFLILTGYYILRPLREEMGLAGGVRNLPWLYLANLGVMLVLTPVFGAVASRWPRRIFLPATYLFFMINMLVFYGLGKTTGGENELLLGRVFYVWVSVYNMWAVSLFWAFLADGFGLERSKRLFGLIAVGGSLGAVLGSTITRMLVEIIGTANLILVSAAFMLAAVLVFVHMGRRFGSLQQVAYPVSTTPPDRGHFWSGFSEFVRSPYLLTIGLYMFLFSLLSTFLYFQQAEIVNAEVLGREARARIFADIDLWVNILTLVTQVFLTGRLMTGWGVGRVLMILPVATVIGFVILAVSPILPVLVVFMVIRRAGNYALSRPARETLYTIVNRDQKYKAKSFIDTFIYRGGDALGAAVFGRLGVLGLGLSAIASVAVPVAVIWTICGYYLGMKQKQLALIVGREESDHVSESS